MPLPTIKVSSSQSYDLQLVFDGVASYNIVEYDPDLAGGWRLSKTIQAGAHSGNPQHDTYALTPVPPNAKRLVVVDANIVSATGADPVSMKSEFTQGAKPIHSDEARGTDTGTLVGVSLRAVFEAS